MKEKTKAFYKTVFKFWVKESLIPFAITVITMFIIGLGFYVLGWDNMGFVALFIITWRKIKEIWNER